jgi:CelD/BcsL family acetyltransferase involved in cellulose biosynthesis
LSQNAPRLDFVLTPVADPAALADRWRALEAAADGGFFRGWAFLQCQARHFDRPYLFAATEGGQDVALGLLNRRGDRLYVGETGDERHDALFIEHNGLLLRRGSEAVLRPCLAWLGRKFPIVLSGVDTAHQQAARAVGWAAMSAERFAPAVDLAALAGPFLASLSANARGQINRAMRRYGPDLRIGRAETAETAVEWLDVLIALHEARWQARGQPGAFAQPGARQFHETLIRVAHPLGQVDILRITAGDTEIGYLYNLVHGGVVLNYQSGLVPAVTPQHKPGLVCHALAIEQYRRAGVRLYDLLAGSQRYKTTLAPNGGQNLHWLILFPRRSLRGLFLVAGAALKARLRGVAPSGAQNRVAPSGAQNRVAPSGAQDGVARGRAKLHTAPHNLP